MWALFNAEATKAANKRIAAGVKRERGCHEHL